MRIGTTGFDTRILGAMDRLSAAQAREQAAIARGTRLAAASDDPAAAARAERVRRTETDNGRWSRNLDLADARLQTIDGALGSLGTALQRARELALLAANDTASPADRQIHLGELTRLREGLVGLANARDGQGAYLFGGATVLAPPFAQEPLTGAVVYAGEGEPATTAIAPDAAVQTGEEGARLFGAVGEAGSRSVFAVVDDLIAALVVAPATVGDETGRAALSAALDLAVDGLAAAGERVAIRRADVGGRLVRVTDARDRLQATGETLAAERSRLEDTDYAAAITRLTRATTILEATRQSFAQVRGLSLFDALR